MVDKPRLWALQREKARLTGNKGEQLALIARAEQKIAETQQQILALEDNMQKSNMQNLTNSQGKLIDVLKREKSAKDILNRTTIVAL